MSALWKIGNNSCSESFLLRHLSNLVIHHLRSFVTTGLSDVEFIIKTLPLRVQKPTAPKTYTYPLAPSPGAPIGPPCWQRIPSLGMPLTSSPASSPSPSPES